MKKAIFYTILLLLLMGCSENDDVDQTLSKEPPGIPQDVSLDLNNDGEDDIAFKFFQDDVVTDGSPGYVGHVYPLNGGSLLLFSIPNEGAYVLELQQNDTIRMEETESFVWYPSNWGFMFIDDSPEGLWPLEWHLSSLKPSNPYYLGVQVKENDDFLMGWMKLSIDRKTAVVKLLDHELVSDLEVVIDN